nr:hypothetical protein B0A51_06978 [Rachicladosporium sp. CCFEE 5018]
MYCVYVRSILQGTRANSTWRNQCSCTLVHVDAQGFRAISPFYNFQHTIRHTLINFVLQCLFVTLGAGFAVGTIDEKSTVSTAANRALIGALVVVWAWSKVFGDSPWLSRMYGAMLRGVTGRT